MKITNAITNDVRWEHEGQNTLHGAVHITPYFGDPTRATAGWSSGRSESSAELRELAQMLLEAADHLDALASTEARFAEYMGA